MSNSNKESNIKEEINNNKEPDHLMNQRIIFASLFHVSNKLQTFLDSYLKPDDLTGKQFLLMIEIGSLGPEGGLLKEVAKRSESSHQNVKQIALKLEKNGYVSIEKDTIDRRATRLRLTKKALEYWQMRAEEDLKMLKALFHNFSEDQLDIMAKCIIHMKENIDKMEDIHE